jgi:hypothetical protein
MQALTGHAVDSFTIFATGCRKARYVSQGQKHNAGANFLQFAAESFPDEPSFTERPSGLNNNEGQRNNDKVICDWHIKLFRTPRHPF